MSTYCKLVSAAGVISGTMSITKLELYFEIDEENEDNKKLGAKVCQILYKIACNQLNAVK